ncbi:MAG: Lrp/AsnC ligand binding domain-containing protein [Chloroflexi bacterium]|nr:Lrp/AsnC ligand binding domain-containing protein [Chloroflexota bacterium]
MTSAFVFIQISIPGGMGDANAIHKALHAVEGVKTVHFLAGPIDVIAFVEAADQQAMMQTIGKLRTVKGVVSTDTRIVLPL